MVALLRLPKGKRMLEVGCGGAVALAPLNKRCSPSHLTGIDIDARALADGSERLARRGVECSLLLADVRKMPFRDGSFDIIVDFGTCYHIADAERALSEITRVLTEGGNFAYETRLSQLMSHPLRSLGRFIPWEAAPELRMSWVMPLWAVRTKRVRG